jgi:hypothetical protein
MVKQTLIVALGVLALAALPLPGRAEWGWPPPGYSTTGVRACDGYHYRGLCEVVRDWWSGARSGWNAVSGAPGGAAPCAVPAAPAVPLVLPPPPPNGGAHP